MNEFRKSATKLGRATRRETQAVFFETISHLNTVLTALQADVKDIKVRMGKLASQLSNFAAQEINELVGPLTLRIDSLAADVEELQTRMAELEARAVGDGSRSLGGEG